MKSSEFRIYRLLTSLEAISKGGLIAIALGIVLILGTIDYITGFELSSSIFYLIPVAMIAWAVSRESGLIFSALCAVVWFTFNQIGACAGRSTERPAHGVLAL